MFGLKEWKQWKSSSQKFPETHLNRLQNHLQQILFKKHVCWALLKHFFTMDSEKQLKWVHFIKIDWIDHLSTVAPTCMHQCDKPKMAHVVRAEAESATWCNSNWMLVHSRNTSFSETPRGHVEPCYAMNLNPRRYPEYFMICLRHSLSNIHIPVEPHEAVAEVSRIGNV